MVAPLQPNPLRSGVMTLPRRKPTPVERAMANRLSVREQFESRRPMSEVLAEGADVMEGIGAGAVAGIGGFFPDVFAILGRDAPILFSKYALGIPLSEDENAVFRALTKAQDAFGAEAIMRGMGYGERIDAPSDSDDALSRAGINPFRQGAFAGEFLADPFAALKAAKLAKATFGGSRSTDALADAAAGDAAAREDQARALLLDPGELPEIKKKRDVDDLAADAFFDAGPRNLDYAGLSDNDLVQAYNRAVDTYNQRRTDGTTDDTFTVTEFDRVQQAIQSEIAGRRGNEHRRLTEDELTEARDRQEAEQQFDALDSLLTDRVDETVLTAQNVARVGRGEVEDEIPALFSEGFQSQPGGIGSLDPKNPVFAQNAVKIGGEDEFVGKVRHYSPALTSFVNMVDSGKFARAANKNGEITGTQFLSMLKGDAGVMSEVKDSPFETALLKDPNQKFTAEEIRRLMTTRLPQTRTRLFLNRTVDAEEQAGTAPARIAGRTSRYESSQMPDELLTYESASRNDPDPRVGYFTMVMSNTTGNVIDVPGFGLMKAADIDNHDYFSPYPGFYGHARGIGVKEYNTNDLYGYAAELQSNHVSNADSGSKILSLYSGTGKDEYYRTLDQRLDGWRQGFQRGAEQSIRVPFTPEVSRLMQQRLELRPDALRKVEEASENLTLAEKRIAQRRRESPSFDDFEPFRADPQGDDFRADSLRAGIAYAQSMPQVGRLSSTVKRNYKKLFFPERVSGGYLNVRETGDPYFPSLDTIGAQGSIKDFLDSTGQPSSPVLLGSLRSQIRETRRLITEMSEKDYIIGNPEIKRRFPIVVESSPRGTPGRENKTVAEIFSNLPEEEQLEIAGLEISTKLANAHYVNTLTGQIFSDPVFLKKLRGLSQDERDLLQAPGGSLDLAGKIASSFSKADKQKFAEYAETAQQETDRLFGANASGLSREQRFLILSSKSLTSNESLKDFINISIREDTVNNIFKYADHLEDERKISNLRNFISDQTLTKEYQDAFAEFEQKLAQHPDGENMKTLVEIAKATSESEGREGFISPAPYSNEADFYSGGLRMLAKELQARGYKGMIVPDWRAVANERGFAGGRVGEEARPDDDFVGPMKKTNETAANRFAKFKKLYGTALDKSIREFEKAGGTVEVRNTQPGNEFYIGFGGSPKKLVAKASQYDPNLDSVVEVDVPLRILRFDTPEGKELLSGPIRRAKGGPVDLRPKKRVHSGIGGMARQVM